MPKVLVRLLMMVAVWVIWPGNAADCQSIVVQHFPQRQDMLILCWSISEHTAGGLSQIHVIETDNRGIAKLLCQSPLEYSYSPQIRFIPEITQQGIPLALIERQTGAASSQLDVIGRKNGRVARLLKIDGFKFDVEQLEGGELPFVIAHSDASILDVPEIYRWSDGRFVEDNACHPAYYRQLLAEDKESLSGNSSGAVLINLSRIALLAGERNEARAILIEALSRERSKGHAADQETFRLVKKALNALALPLDTRACPPIH